MKYEYKKVLQKLTTETVHDLELAGKITRNSSGFIILRFDDFDFEKHIERVLDDNFKKVRELKRTTHIYFEDYI